MNCGVWICLTSSSFPKTSHKLAHLAIKCPFCCHSPCGELQSPGGRNTSAGKPLLPNTHCLCHVHATYTVSLTYLDHSFRGSTNWSGYKMHTHAPLSLSQPDVESQSLWIIQPGPQESTFPFSIVTLCQSIIQGAPGPLRNCNTTTCSFWSCKSCHEVQIPSDMQNVLENSQSLCKVYYYLPVQVNKMLEKNCGLTHLIQINFEIWFILNMLI